MKLLYIKQLNRYFQATTTEQNKKSMPGTIGYINGFFIFVMGDIA